MESHILAHARDRNEKFRPNDKLDKLIAQLRELLVPVQQQVNDRAGTPRYPVIGIAGCPRSGTTFMTQLLAATGAVAYPSNLLSRFAYAPHVGALIQQMLLNPEYDLGDEFSDLRSFGDFSSDIGKTRGALGINEFFHFWRKFMPVHDPGHLADAELEQVDVAAMRKELASIQDVYGKPFMSKVMMLQYNLAYFARALPELKIIHVHRDPLYLMQSVSQARIKYYGNNRIWWSVKPKEYSFLKDADPATQVAGQVLYTDRAITQQLCDLPEDRWISVSYESVCENPREFLAELAERFSMPELARDMTFIQERYPSGNTRRLPDHELAELQESYQRLANIDAGESSP